jgi:hypothetical protein
VEWRTPPIWLQPFPSEFGWSYTATRRRLQIWHPAGFPVLDTVRTQQPLSEQIQHEMALLNSIDMPIAQQKRRRSPLHTSRLQRWLGWMVAYLQARIRRALGYESDQSLQPLFALPATIWVTLDRIDLQFQLADLPIEVRLAGLDRNPGWIPASGYAIYFHFQVEE